MICTLNDDTKFYYRDIMCTLYYLDTYQVEYIKMYKYKLEYKGVI